MTENHSEDLVERARDVVPGGAQTGLRAQILDRYLDDADAVLATLCGA
jgi:hypothetical protein